MNEGKRVGDGEEMDKQRKQISIKINGSERPFTTEKMSSPKQAEIEVCAAKEEEEVPLLEELGNKTGRNIVDFTQLRKSAIRKTKRKSFSSFVTKKVKAALVSIFTAVMIGTGFGLVMLHFISNQKANENLEENHSLSSNPAFLPANDNTKEPGLGENVKQSSLSIYVIQAGVFSTSEAAQEYANKLKSFHIPTVVVGENPTSLFIGIGMEKEALRPISERYKEAGQDTYIKPLTFDIAADSKIKSLLVTSQPFYEKLISISAQLLEGNTLSNETWTELEKEYKQFLSIEIPDDTNAAKYEKYLKNTYSLLTSYRQTNDIEKLSNAQQELLKALLSYITYANK
jgi:stage II sporulation protein B